MFETIANNLNFEFLDFFATTKCRCSQKRKNVGWQMKFIFHPYSVKKKAFHSEKNTHTHTKKKKQKTKKQKNPNKIQIE